MSKRKSTKRAPKSAPATKLKMSQRQRDRANRALLKRRRAKSGQ